MKRATRLHPAVPAVPASCPGTGGAPLSNRQRFLDACGCKPVDRPPLWLMRQAGRALPEYRALKEKHSFLEMVQTPELAAEVTLQPIRRFDFDAAILFSDILVVAEAMGQGYRFAEKGGIEMEFLLKGASDIQRLDPGAVPEKLQYAAKALRLVKSALAGRTALIGFAGSPWTLANYMIEGGGVEEYTKARALFCSEPKLFEQFMEKLTCAVTASLELQIDAGAEAVQIFDSLGGLLSEDAFAAASGQWLKRIVGSLRNRVPVIVFARDVNNNWADLVETGASVLGVDWTVRLADVAGKLPSSVAVQGNLDPSLLAAAPETVAAEAGRILREMRGRPGHIFNLGHGVPPNARLENIETLVRTVREEARFDGRAAVE
jgi:uroporphyrinogen decarboxylase